MTDTTSSHGPGSELLLTLSCVLAAVAVGLSLWSGVAPLGVGLMAWFARIMPTLGSGNLLIATRDTAVLSLSDVLIGLLFALPFALSAITARARKEALLSGAIAIVLGLFAFAALLRLPPYPVGTIGWRDVLALGLSSLVGLMLIALSFFLWRQSDSTAWIRLYAGACVLSGFCLTTVVLMPLGLALLLLVYLFGALHAGQSLARRTSHPA